MNPGDWQQFIQLGGLTIIGIFLIQFIKTLISVLFQYLENRAKDQKEMFTNHLDTLTRELQKTNESLTAVAAVANETLREIEAHRSTVPALVKELKDGQEQILGAVHSLPNKIRKGRSKEKNGP